MTIEVRTVDSSELSQWVACKDLGFLKQRTESEDYVRYFSREVELDRTWGSVDGDRIVGTLRSFPTSLTVPGPSSVLASALTNVTVAPTHRRRGLLTRMITGELTSSRERGEPVSILIASEYPIYGRFGFGAASRSASYSVDADLVRFRDARESTGGGTVDLVGRDSLRKEAPGVYEVFRSTQPGAIGREDLWWDRRLNQVDVPGHGPPKSYCALYREPSGEALGYLVYEAQPKWRDMRPEGVITVEELVSVSPGAYRALWKFCCDVDLVSVVNSSDRSVQEVLPWLLEDARTVRQTSVFDFLWARILDVPAALSARRYRTEGRVVLHVHDPLGFASGTYLVEGGPEGSHSARTQEPAALSMSVDTLGSLYLGGVPATVLAAGGRMDEIEPGALETVDRMFGSDVAPWCSTWF